MPHPTLTNLYPPDSYAARYTTTLTGDDLRRMQLMANAARASGPAGLTVFFINVDEMRWLKTRLQQIKAAAGEEAV